MVPALTVLGGVVAGAQAQPSGIGLELQGYPAGVIPAVFVEAALGRGGWMSASLGWNLTYRRDFGEHEDERGGGPGAGLAWHTGLAAVGRGLVVGARIDLWFLDIDWRDPGPRVGKTEVTVLQPTARAGYEWVAGAVRGAVLVGLGWEVNVLTVGEAVGRGPVALVGVRATWRRQ